MKTKITLMLSFFICLNSIQSQINVIEHCVTYGSLLESGSVSVIDHPLFNENPDRNLVLEKIRLDDNGVYINNPGIISLEYDSALERWVIFDEDGSELLVDVCYNIAIVGSGKDYSFEAKCDASAIDPMFPNSCIVDYPEINDNSSSRCMFSSVRDSDNVINDHSYDLYYNYANPGQWLFWTLAGVNVPVGAVFNVICDPPGFIYYEHLSTSDNIGSLIVSASIYSIWTTITHPLLDNNPNAKIFAAHRREPATSFFLDSHSVGYDTVTGKWQIHWELETLTSSDTTFPEGLFWNVFIVDEALSTEDSVMDTAIKSFPNPVSDIITLESKFAMDHIEIFNLVGQKMGKINSNGNTTLQLDMSHYALGTYFAKIYIEKTVETVKLLKN